MSQIQVSNLTFSYDTAYDNIFKNVVLPLPFLPISPSFQSVSMVKDAFGQI